MCTCKDKAGELYWNQLEALVTGKEAPDKSYGWEILLSLPSFEFLIVSPTGQTQLAAQGKGDAFHSSPYLLRYGEEWKLDGEGQGRRRGSSQHRRLRGIYLQRK